MATWTKLGDGRLEVMMKAATSWQDLIGKDKALMTAIKVLAEFIAKQLASASGFDPHNQRQMRLQGVSC